MAALKALRRAENIFFKTLSGSSRTKINFSHLHLSKVGIETLTLTSRMNYWFNITKVLTFFFFLIVHLFLFTLRSFTFFPRSQPIFFLKDELTYHTAAVESTFNLIFFIIIISLSCYQCGWTFDGTGHWPKTSLNHAVYTQNLAWRAAGTVHLMCLSGELRCTCKIDFNINPLVSDWHHSKNQPWILPTLIFFLLKM